MGIVVAVIPRADAVRFLLLDGEDGRDPLEPRAATITGSAVIPAIPARARIRGTRGDLFTRGLLPGSPRPGPGGAGRGRGFAGAGRPRGGQPRAARPGGGGTAAADPNRRRKPPWIPAGNSSITRMRIRP